MEQAIKKMLPVGAPLPPLDSVDLSFALEYSGPALPFDIPKATPIDLESIPFASIAASGPLLDSLPVVHPLPFKDRDLTSSPDESSRSSADFGDDFESSPSLDDDEDASENPPLESQSPILHPESRSNPQIKTASCRLCSRTSWFMEKEACMACGARYCGSCVLQAMGSMPEGRKCVGCIGSPIEDSKREKLGRSSRLLKRLLSMREVEQVMKAERYCEANQLRPEHVYVNGKALTQEEMAVLLGCARPPTKLKPGYYWYDKVSGFWGKEGHKPDKIITAHLTVGGGLMQNASRGNTGILINGREITKEEKKMLKSAGIQCAGDPHFWVDADGTIREEGQKNAKGKIWGKFYTKLLCSIYLSLPVPSKGGFQPGEEVNNMRNRVVPCFFEQKTFHKLFLVGNHGSGTSTIFKQVKFLYEHNPFSEDERESIKLLIQRNLYSYLGTLLEGRKRFEEESLAEKKNIHPCAGTGNDASNGCGDATVYSISPRLKAFSDWILNVIATGSLELEAIFPSATTIEELWRDAAIQATYSRRRELESLPSSASYFLQKVVDISRDEYVPSDLDILRADGITPSCGLAHTNFVFPRPAYEGNGNDAAEQQEPLVRYQLIRLPKKGLGKNCKWMDMFEDVRIVIFCVCLSDYDEYLEDAVTNKMMDTRRLFESIITHSAFNQKNCLLILNKFDLLEEKIDHSPLTVCDWFRDYSPAACSSRSSINDATKAQQAYHYIAVKFKRLFASLTGRNLFVTMMKGLESQSVDDALRYARDILKWDEERRSSNEIYSYEQTSTV